MYYLYTITNKKTNKKYLGMTSNPHQRESRHFSDLRGNRHHCAYLQRSFNKHGEENFVFEIIFENMTEEKASRIEEMYLVNHYDNLYNTSKKSGGGDLISYHPEIDRIKEQHSIAGLIWWKTKSEEEKKEFGDKFRGEKNAMYGRTHAPEAREKISSAHKGRKISEERKKTISEAQRERFSVLGEREKVSERNRKRYEDPEERNKTSLANKKRFENPEERETIRKASRKRNQKDYKVFFPDGDTMEFTNLIDIIEYFMENHSIGRWTINSLLKTGQTWNPFYEKHKYLTGLKITVNENKSKN